MPVNNDPNQIQADFNAMDDTTPPRWSPELVSAGVAASFMIGSPQFAKPFAVNKNDFSVTAAPVIMAAKLEAAMPDAKTRMQVCKEKMQVFENDYGGLVKARLQEIFHPENYKRMRLQMHLSSNLLERVVNDISILYANPAKRNLVPKPPMTPGGSTEPGEIEASDTTPKLTAGVPSTRNPIDDEPDIKALKKMLGMDEESTENEAAETSFDRLMRLQDWDVLMDTVEKLCSFLPVVWVHPNVMDGRLNYVIYTPGDAQVVTDENNPHVATGFWYFGTMLDPKKNEMVTVIHFWTDKTYSLLDADWKTLKVEPHKLGRLPITAFRIKVPINKYYCDGMGDDLYEGTMELALLRTMQNARVRDSAFKQLAIQGDTDKIDADQVMGGPTPIFLGDAGQAQVLDLQANIKEYTDLCRERGLELAAKYGITSADYTSDKVPQSGFSKKLDQAKITKESRRRRKFFAVAEADLYDLVALTVQNYPVPEIGDLPLDMTLAVEFGEAVFEEDPEKQNRIDAEDLRLNKVSILDILRRDNPDLTDIEVLRKAKENQLINQMFMPTGGAASLYQMLADEAVLEGVKGGKGAQGALQSKGPTPVGGAGPGSAPNGAGAGGTAAPGGSNGSKAS